MPGALAPLHVNERKRRRLTHKGHGGKERRDASFLPAKGLPRGTGGCKEDRQQGNNWEGALNLG